MNRFIVILFLFTLSCWYEARSQSGFNIDSLKVVEDTIGLSIEKVENLSRLYNATLYSSSDLAYKYALQELKTARTIDYPLGVGLAYYHLGVYHNNTDHADSAKYYYLLAKGQFEQLNDLERIVNVNHGLAIIEYSQGHYDEAIEILKSNVTINLEKKYDSLITENELNLAVAYDLMGQIQLFKGNHNIALRETLKALQILDSLDEPIRKADALNHLASIEFYLNNYENTINYNKEALQIYHQYNDKYYASQVLNDIGNTYYYLKKYDSAIAYLDKAVLLSREIKSSDIEGTALNNLGKVYSQLGEFSKSISLSEQALQIHEKTGSKNKIVESLADLGMVYNEMKLYRRAIQYFDQALELAIEIGVKENIRMAYYDRAISYEKLGNFQQALLDYKAYKNMEDSIFSETKSQQIEEMRTIYETEKKEQQIALQQNEIDLLEEKNKVNLLRQILLIAGIFLCIIIIGLVYFAMRQKVKRKQLEKEVIDKELEFKKQELTTHALHLANKNEILEDLKDQIIQLKKNGSQSGNFSSLVNTIKLNLQDDKNWENFSKYFEQVHKDFNSKIKRKYPQVTAHELRLMALLKMNLSSKEIANILNISNEGIKKARYRLRKKLNIGSEDSLNDLIIGL